MNDKKRIEPQIQQLEGQTKQAKASYSELNDRIKCIQHKLGHNSAGLFAIRDTL